MDQIKILIVEDDPMIAAEISDYLFDLGYAVLSVCRSYDQALKVLDKTMPDVALLDIELSGKESGVDLARFIRAKNFPIPIVFLTSQTDPRIIESVKETRPDGFIVKPFDERDLSSNIEIALYRYSQNGSTQKDVPKEKNESIVLNNFFFVRNKNSLIKIDLQKIVWVEADDNYSYLHTETERYIVSSTLKLIEEKLPKQYFQRVHRSFIVNLNFLDKVEEQSLSLGKVNIPIGRSYRQDLLDRISTL